MRAKAKAIAIPYPSYARLFVGLGVAFSALGFAYALFA